MFYHTKNIHEHQLKLGAYHVSMPALRASPGLELVTYTTALFTDTHTKKTCSRPNKYEWGLEPNTSSFKAHVLTTLSPSPAWMIMSPCLQPFPSHFSLCIATRDTFLKQRSALVTSLQKPSNLLPKDHRTFGRTRALSLKTFQIAQQATSFCVLDSGLNYLTCILTP